MARSVRPQMAVAAQTILAQLVTAAGRHGYIQGCVLLKSESTKSSKIPFCQTPVGLSTWSMFERALHRQPGVGSSQPQEQVLRLAGVWHLHKWNL